MARCTLDDLVPSFRCRRVFLEPLSSGYSSYSVQIEGSVYDRVEDEDDGVADYLLSDTFKDNITTLAVHCRSNSVQNMIDYLRTVFVESGEVREWKVTALFLAAFEGLDTDFSSYSYQQMLNHTTTFAQGLATDSKALQIFGLIINTSQFKTSLAQFLAAIMQDAQAGGLDLVEIKFKNYTNELIENFGSVSLDSDGNKVYDLMIPRQDLTFENDMNVQECYFHAMNYFDIENLLSDNGIPVTADQEMEVMQWMYSEIHSCHILSQNIAASPNVQDFRLSERIAEIIRPDRISIYDSILDNVATISDSREINNSGITTDLYCSYLPSAGSSVFVRGIFYINFTELIKRRTKHGFMLNNIPFTVGTNIQENIDVMKLHVYRVRTDSKEERVFIGSASRIAGRIQNSIGYEFKDRSFSDLNDGNYTYEFEIEFVDPVFDMVEREVANLKYGIKCYSDMISYIHNNPAQYNELRDELTGLAKTNLEVIAKTPSSSGITYENYMNSFMNLFALMTGFPPALLDMFIYGYAQGIGDQTLVDELLFISPFERRKIENTHRIMQDVLFAADKFFETRAIDGKSASTIQSGKELISYSRMWNVEVSPDVKDRGILGFSSNQQLLSGFSASEYGARMTQEFARLNIDPELVASSGLNIVNLATIIPDRLGDVDLHSTTQQGNIIPFFKMMSDVLDVRGGEQEMENALRLFNDSSQMSVRELKNNSGLFESFLHNLGASCDNKSSTSVNSYATPENIIRQRFSLAIDDGENLSQDNASSQHGQLSLYGTDDDEELDTTQDDQALLQGLAEEYRRKEFLIMMLLISDKGYSLLDRKEFSQGTHQTIRFNNNFSYPEDLTPNQRYTAIHALTDSYIDNAYNGKGNPLRMPLYRLILDNTFFVYYLSSIDENMNPTWTRLSNFDVALDEVRSTGQDRMICKLKRYEDSKLHIGQGSESDREILSKYFYLFV